MAIKIYGGNHGIATANVIPDNTSEALDIQGTDANEYISIDTVDSNPLISLKAADGSPGKAFEVRADGAVGFNNSNSGWMTYEDTTATNPTVGPRKSDWDTGIGSAAADQLSLIAGGVEGIRIVEDTTCKVAIGEGTAPAHTLHVQDGDAAVVTNSADAVAKSLVFTKSRNATAGDHTVVQDNDVLGEIKFQGSDGDSFEGGASIKSRVDGTPADGKMPGDLVLSTSPDTTTGGHTLGDMVERLVIDDLGQPAFKTDTAQLLAFDRYVSSSVLNYGALRTDTNGITMLVTRGGNSSNFSIHANYVQRYNLTSDKGFEIYNGHSVPSASVTDGVILYAEDASSSSELKVRDEAGNITVLSPHNFSVTERSDPMAWSHYSKNPFVGKEINVDMMKVIKAVEQLSGQSFIQERDLDPSECRDWDTEEQVRVAKSQEAIDEWDNQTPEDRGEKPRPELYAAQPKPDWMN